MTTRRAYRVLTHDLSYATDRGAIARIKRGEKVPARDRKEKQAKVGDVVTDLPSESIPGLLEHGYIEEVVGG